MNDNKAVIMSMKGRYTVAYTQDGQFIKIARKKHHRVGQILSLENKKPLLGKLAAGWQMAAIAATVLLIFSMGILYPLTQHKAEAYLSMGLNTGSTELWIDKNNKVIKINYPNQLSELEKIDVKGKDVYKAVTTLISEAKRLGMLDNRQENLLLLDLGDLTEEQNHNIEVTKFKEAIMNGLGRAKYNGIMVISRHGKEFIQKAGESSLTASQYYVYEKSHAKGFPLTAEQIKHGPIRSVLSKVGTTPEELFGINNKVQSDETNNNKNLTNHPDSHHDMSPLVNQKKENHEAPAMPNNEYHRQMHSEIQGTQMPSNQTDIFEHMSNPTPQDGHEEDTDSMMGTESNRTH